MLTPLGHDGSRVTLLADFEVDLIRDACPQWQITRMGSLIRAEREGYKTRFAQTGALLLAVLAGIERSRHPGASAF